MFETRVLVVSEDLLSRTGLSTIVIDDGELELSGQLDPISLNQEMVSTFQPDVILWDIGLGSTRDINSRVESPIVVLYHPSQELELYKQENIMGYVARTSSAAQIIAALQAVHQGFHVTDLKIDLEKPLLDFDEDWNEELTVREIEVLRLVAEGSTNRSIANDLGITEHTVKFHVNSILGKLSAESRTAAAMKAVRKGIIPL